MLADQASLPPKAGTATFAIVAKGRDLLHSSHLDAKLRTLRAELIERAAQALDPITASERKALDLCHPWERKGEWEDDTNRGYYHPIIISQ